MNKISKAIGALLGGVTGAGVIALFASADLHLDPLLASAIAALLSAVGAFLAPKNAE